MDGAGCGQIEEREDGVDLVRREAPLLVTSVLFGLCHAYQGPWRIAETAVFGLILGAFFLWLRTIWPLVLAHAAQGFFALADPSFWMK